MSRYYLQNPLIHITDKWNRLDIFWFNFFHELGHVYSEHISKTVANLDISDSKAYKTSPEEEEANIFACKAILSEEIYNKVKQNPKHATIQQQAKEAGIHVSLLYGRLCRDNILQYQKVNRYMKRLHS
ncbi:MAG: ImmA/IrrE family metallo-endopeptidase [Candidatus Peribacteria bacterium]|nr:ImmA/IrrE family metallo-endopeptidase [Candidatus Peribacteria bacterium]